MDDPTPIAVAIFEAYRDKDRAKLEALIADDFRFTSPLDNGLDRPTYLERCWPNSAYMTALDVVATARSSDRVYVTYEGAAGAKRFRNTEALTVRGGKVVAVEVYFGWDVPPRARPKGWVEEG